MRRKPSVTLIAAALSVVALAAVANHARADQISTTADLAQDDMVAALQRDLGLTEQAARARLAREEVAGRTGARLRDHLGSDFGGAWLAADGSLVVAVSDATRADEVRRAGAQARVVARGARDLDAVVDRLNATEAPAAVRGWHVDLADNRVVVFADPAALAAAAEFVKTSGVETNAVRVQASTQRVEQLHHVRGGDPLSLVSPCSIGFSVTHVVSGPDEPGLVTAGHCVEAGLPVFGHDGGELGVVRGRVLGSQDYAWAEVNAGLTMYPWVTKYNGSNVVVSGAQVAAVGASVCRSGQATGWRCGTIQARNATLVVNGRQQTGLIKASTCADNGDSGGSLLAGGQAQGIASVGTEGTGCLAPTYFQPVLPVLLAYDLVLLDTGPMIVSMSCETNIRSFLCDVTRLAGATLTWTVNGAARPDWTNDDHVTGACGTSATAVRATVSNSRGTVSVTRAPRCDGGHH